jgi:beta-mannan synthase
MSLLHFFEVWYYFLLWISGLTCALFDRSLHLLVFWILFENVMSLHRTKATIIGLFDIGNVNEWVVTEKLGNLMKYRSAKYGKKYTLQRMASNILARGWKMSER